MRLMFYSILLSIFVLQSVASATSKKPALPKVIIFDVNETLLDLESLQGPVGQQLNGRKDLLGLWFSRMLHYSLVSVAINDYKDFGTVGVAALRMIGEENNIAITEKAAKEAIFPTLLNLKPHADVITGLNSLKDKKFKLVTFTNSTSKAVSTQLKNAKIEKYFQKSFSTDEIKTYKPFLQSYEWILDEMEVKPEEALMVASHGWDIAGAQAAGLQTAFITRKGQSLYPLSPAPTYKVMDLNELAKILNKISQ